MRYRVGNTYVFIRTQHKEADGSTTFNDPWIEEITAVDIIEVLCWEHHKVKGNASDKLFDSFIFRDKYGELHYNQYPES